LLVEGEQCNKYKKKSRNASPACGAIVLLLEHASAAFRGEIVRMPHLYALELAFACFPSNASKRARRDIRIFRSLAFPSPGDPSSTFAPHVIQGEKNATRG
jgi:hypothetical protein